MDIAAATGTLVRAPASGIVSFADTDLYLTGGTLVIDHGHGVSSTFLHLSRIDVAVGDVVRQGQAIAAVGASGRATGPHLHWGMKRYEMFAISTLSGSTSPSSAQNRATGDHVCGSSGSSAKTTGMCHR